MASEIVDSIMKNDPTYREERLRPSDVNMTEFMEDKADLFVFRVVSHDPYNMDHSGSRFSQKAHYLSPNGNVKQTRGVTASPTTDESMVADHHIIESVKRAAQHNSIM